MLGTYGAMELEPIRVLDREAVRKLLEEDGDSTEYCLVLHNRAVEKVGLGAWNALPGVKGRGSTAVPKLRSLDLSFNRLAEVDVQVFAPLGELRELKLYSNRLTDEVSCGQNVANYFIDYLTMIFECFTNSFLRFWKNAGLTN